MAWEARTALRRSIDVAGQCRNSTRNARTCTGGEPPNAIRCGVLLKAEDPRKFGTGCGDWR